MLAVAPAKEGVAAGAGIALKESELEMLADMLLLDGKVTEALQAYRASLLSDPNRFNALLGAGRAAELSGQRAPAERYYRTLVANCTAANGAALDLLRHARVFVAEVSGGRHVSGGSL